MNITHHPHDDLLVAYAAGDLAEAWSLLVATHAALCPSCRAEIGKAEAMGGWLIDEAVPVTVSEGALAQTLTRVAEVDREPRRETAESSLAGSVRPVLPEPLRSYAGGDLDALSWRKLGRKVSHIPLVSGANGTTARLLRIPAGEAVPEHGHNGTELTLVLAGSFCDGSTRFARGDVETADDEVVHQPVAEPGETCICLAVTDAPLRFRGWVARLVQPFVGI